MRTVEEVDGVVGSRGILIEEIDRVDDTLDIREVAGARRNLDPESGHLLTQEAGE